MYVVCRAGCHQIFSPISMQYRVTFEEGVEARSAANQ